MEYEDRVRIATPEGVELELVLAGLGSRAVAGGFDFALKLLLLGLVAFLLFGTSLSGSGGAGVAVFAAASFCVYFGFDVAFEVLGAGRTPGKRFTGLRVVSEGGSPVGLRRSAVRNLVRIVDGPATGYALGSAFILFSPRNQRLGDHAAGTLVVRERHAADTVAARTPRRRGRASRGGAATVAPAAAAPPDRAFDVSAVTPEEIATVRSFLARRAGLDAGARHGLAVQLSQRLRPKVVGAPESDGEPFLEWLASAKAARG